MNRRKILIGLGATFAAGATGLKLFGTDQQPDAPVAPEEIVDDIEAEMEDDLALPSRFSYLLSPDLSRSLPKMDGADESAQAGLANPNQLHVPEAMFDPHVTSPQKFVLDQPAVAAAKPVVAPPAVVAQTPVAEVPAVAVQVPPVAQVVPPVVQRPVSITPVKPVIVIDQAPQIANVPLPVRRPSDFKIADSFPASKIKPVVTKPVVGKPVAIEMPEPKKFELFKPWINRNPSKAVAFYNPHHEEWLKIDLKNPDWSEVNRFARDPWNKMEPIDKSLITSRISEVYNALMTGGATIRSITAISIYRSPEYNEFLRNDPEHGGQAKKSIHRIGKAFDAHFVGVSTSTLNRVGEQTARAAGRGGTGYYPGLDFVHLDVGRKREWNG